MASAKRDGEKAPSGKASKKEKGKKNKGTTLKLNEFLAGTTPAARTVQISSSSWADEVEEDQYPRTVENIELPTAPRAARGADVDMERVPNRPPFTAYIGNLPFDVEDVEIENFFHKLEVVGIRIPDGRVKKFGYVEFADQQNLLEALALNDQKMRNNLIRVDLAEGQQRDTDRDNRRSGFGDRDRDIDESRTEGDWRKKGPSDGPRGGSSFGDRDRGGYGDRDRGGYGDRDRDRGYGGDRDRGYGGDRDRGYGDRDRDRGYGGDRDRDRGGSRGFSDWNRDRDRDRGYGGDRDRGYGGDRDRGYGGDRDRGYGGDRDRGYGGDRDRGYGGDRDGGRRSFGSGYSRDSDRGGDRYGDRDRYGGRDDRYGGRDDRYGNRDRYDRMDRRGDDDRGPSREPVGERPRLKLAPRTKPLEPSTPQQQSSGGSGSSIFGGAKPVDTAAKEREIEDRLKRQKEFESEKLEQEKENRENRYRLSSSTSDRGRHNSQSDESSAPRRERKSSSSSGKGIRTVAPPPGVGSARIRRDSTLSDPEDVFDEEKPPTKTSPKKEEDIIVPAPPPKENAWTKRLEPKTSTSSESKDKPEPSRQNSQSKEDFQQNPKSPKDTSPKNIQPAPAPKQSAWSKGRPEIIPADTPKENAWAKRSAQSSTENEKNNSRNNSERGTTGEVDHMFQPIQPVQIQHSTGTVVTPILELILDGGEREGFSGSHWGGNRRKDGPPAASRDGDHGGQRGGRGGKTRERPLPKSIDEMPQYSAKSDKDWSDANKFSTLLGADDDDDAGKASDQ